MPGGRPRVVFTFTIGGNKITGIGLTAHPEQLTHIDLEVLDGPGTLTWDDRARADWLKSG